jgi:two-component sensor histidine kinase
MIKLTVSDDGVGMTEGVIEALGYRVVRALVAQHEGSLRLSSGAQGTAVEVIVTEEKRNESSGSLE